VKLGDVRGHDAAVARLRRVAREGRVAGSYLVVGPPGVGKRTLADAFTARLLCAAPVDDDACGTCAQCTRVASGAHPDVRVVTRDAERRDIRIEQARDLCRWLTLRPLMASRKVAIVDGAEHLNEHGQNALLKTLEEPPGAAVLVLVATTAALLLPTVRSRCQRVRLDPLAPEAVVPLLVARGVPADRAAALASEADGSPGRALALAGEDHARLRTLVLDVCAGLAERAAADLSQAAQEMGRGDVEAGLAVAAAWYRDVVGVAVGASRRLRHPDAAGAVARAAARLAPAARLRQLAIVCATIDAVARNANRQLALETMWLALRDLERGELTTQAWTSTP
jgi:DNA polymerase-3 subunit delta'